MSPTIQLGTGAVLNGIAYDASRKRLFVTGKLWPSIFEIQLIPNYSAESVITDVANRPERQNVGRGVNEATGDISSINSRQALWRSLRCATGKLLKTSARPQGRAERSAPLRLRQEMQAVLRRGKVD